MLSVGPEYGPHKVLCGQVGLWGAGLSPRPAPGGFLPSSSPGREGGPCVYNSTATGYSKGPFLKTQFPGPGCPA